MTLAADIADFVQQQHLGSASLGAATESWTPELPLRMSSSGIAWSQDTSD